MIVVEITEWILTQEKALFLYKEQRVQKITYDEYLNKAESLFRDYLRKNPHHEQCKQELATILQKRILDLRMIETLFKKQDKVAIETQEQLYRELISLSSLNRFKEGLAFILALQNKNSSLFQEKDKLLALNSELLERFLKDEHFSSVDFADNDIEFLEYFLRLSLKLDSSEKRTKIKLAQILYDQVLKEEKNSKSTLEQLYKNVKAQYKECITLDSDTELYWKRWLQLLERLENDFKQKDQTAEVQNKRVKLLFEILEYDKNNETIKYQLEDLLLKQVEGIYEKEDKGLSPRRVFEELERVYSNLMKVNPSNPVYKYSLTKMKLEEGKYLKGRNQIADAYYLFEHVLRMDPSNFDAVLKIANIHILKSEWSKAHHLLSSLLPHMKSIKGKDSEIEFCLVYAATNAYVNQPEEANKWLEKGIELDHTGKFAEQIFSARVHVNMASSQRFFSVYQIDKRVKMLVNSAEIDQIIHEYEDTRFTSAQPKIFFDFRDMDSLKLIGPKRTKVISAEVKFQLLEYLLESTEPKSIKQINESCFSNEKSDVNIRNQIANIRDDLADLFCQSSSNTEDFKIARRAVINDILITAGSNYQWAFKGETYLIKMD